MDELEELGVFTLALHQGEEAAGLREGIPSRAAAEPPLADAPVLRVYTAEQALGREKAEAERPGGVLSMAARDLAKATAVANAAQEQWLGGWSGGQIWESSELLARVLCLQPPSFWRGRRVVELGCGCGLLGLTAAAFSPREVVLTDQVPEMAHWNALRNFGRAPLFDGPSPPRGNAAELAKLGLLPTDATIRVKRLRWGSQQDIDLACGPAPFDIVLGSDLLYHAAHHRRLATTITQLSGLGTIVLLASPDAEVDDEMMQAFYERLRASGFELEDISEQPEVAELRVLRSAPHHPPPTTTVHLLLLLLHQHHHQRRHCNHHHNHDSLPRLG